MQWNNIRSLRLSILMVRLLSVLIPVLMCCVPVMVHWYDLEGGSRVGLVEGSVYWPLCICLYLSAICGEVCLLRLGQLLQNIRGERVFIRENCAHLRIISWCCLLAAVPFGAFGFWRFLSFLVALAALFFGIVLRVVKNVFEAAVNLQEENDYTI